MESDHEAPVPPLNQLSLNSPSPDAPRKSKWICRKCAYPNEMSEQMAATICRMCDFDDREPDSQRPFQVTITHPASPNEELFLACETQNLEQVERLLAQRIEKRIDVNYRYQGKPILLATFNNDYWAILETQENQARYQFRCKAFEAIRMLVEAGVNLDPYVGKCQPSQASVFHAAICHMPWENESVLLPFIAFLVHNNGNIHTGPPLYATVLQQLMENMEDHSPRPRFRNVLRFLVAHGADPHFVDQPWNVDLNAEKKSDAPVTGKRKRQHEVDLNSLMVGDQVDVLDSPHGWPWTRGEIIEVKKVADQDPHPPQNQHHNHAHAHVHAHPAHNGQGHPNAVYQVDLNLALPYPHHEQAHAPEQEQGQGPHDLEQEQGVDQDNDHHMNVVVNVNLNVHVHGENITGLDDDQPPLEQEMQQQVVVQQAQPQPHGHIQQFYHFHYHNRDRKAQDDAQRSRQSSQSSRSEEKNMTSYVLVHYHGWSWKWDEWIRQGSPRIAKAYTRWRPGKKHVFGATVYERALSMADVLKKEWVVEALDAGLADCAENRRQLRELLKQYCGLPTELADISTRYVI